jgi:catechol 2,3-dioxygenase-like lactoylglutathione lyase family enzyme
VQLDHVIVAVEDLEAATRTFSALLGLPPAVRSAHPRGTRNALFLFERGPYLELLAAWDAPVQGSSAAALRRFLAERGEGLFGLALAPDDLDAAVRRLRALGFDISDPVANAAANEDGRVREWRGAWMPATAGDSSFLVEHRGWDWRAELRPGSLPGRVSSGAVAIHHIAFVVPDAGAASAAWDERFGLPQTEAVISERLGARVNIHAAGGAAVRFVATIRSQGPVAERIGRHGHGLWSLGVAVRDLDAAVAAVRAAGIDARGPEAGLLPGSRAARIDPAAAHGVAVCLLSPA